MRRTSLSATACLASPRTRGSPAQPSLLVPYRPLAPLRVFQARSRRARVLKEALPRARRLRAVDLGLAKTRYTLVVYNLRATAFVSAPEEISACYGSTTGHKSSTEPTSAARGPLTGEIGLAMSMGCESPRARALARHRFQLAGGDASEACENAAPACGGRGTHSAPTERSGRPEPSTDAAAALRPAHTLRPRRWRSERERRREKDAATQRGDARRRTRESPARPLAETQRCRRSSLPSRSRAPRRSSPRWRRPRARL